MPYVISELEQACTLPLPAPPGIADPDIGDELEELEAVSRNLETHTLSMNTRRAYDHTLGVPLPELVPPDMRTAPEVDESADANRVAGQSDFARPNKRRACTESNPISSARQIEIWEILRIKTRSLHPATLAHTAPTLDRSLDRSLPFHSKSRRGPD